MQHLTKINKLQIKKIQFLKWKIVKVFESLDFKLQNIFFLFYPLAYEFPPL